MDSIDIDLDAFASCLWRGGESACAMRAVSPGKSLFTGRDESIVARLRARHRICTTSSGASRALVVAKDAKRQKVMHQFFAEHGTTKPKQVKCSDSYCEGVRAGKEIVLNESIR